MPDLVKAEYQTFEVMFSEEGWFNATTAAEKFGKRVDHWLKTDETQNYIDALARHLNSPKKGDLIKSKRGRNGGTWLHPKLAVAFARWLSPDFSVWCDIQIDRLMSGQHPHYDWKRLRHEATASYKVMGQILQMTRERLGKTCAPHHFSNEARLINWAMTGEFGKVDRERFGTGALALDYDARMQVRQLVADTFSRIVIYHCGITPETGSPHIDLVLMAKGGTPRMLRIDRKSGAWVAQEYGAG